eukprot:6208267-Pleurochrysis_carterae.AAC.9
MGLASACAPFVMRSTVSTCVCAENCFRYEGFKALAESLKYNRAIKRLDLYRKTHAPYSSMICRMRVQRAEGLKEASLELCESQLPRLAQCCGQLSSSMTEIPFGFNGVEELLQMVENSSTLLELCAGTRVVHWVV